MPKLKRLIGKAAPRSWIGEKKNAFLKSDGKVHPKKRFIKHLLVPSLAPALLVCLYFTPKEVFGCANRGFLALAVVFIALVAAVAGAIKGISEKKQGDTEEEHWRIVSALILLSPLFLLVGPLS